MLHAHLVAITAMKLTGNGASMHHACMVTPNYMLRSPHTFHRLLTLSCLVSNACKFQDFRHASYENLLDITSLENEIRASGMDVYA